MKKLIVISLVLLVFITSCSSQDNETDSSNEVVEAVAEIEGEIDEIEELKKPVLPEFDKKTLAMFNGKNGMPAYVAVDGIVYDVSDVAEWQTPHAGELEAGKDYTKEMDDSPHGRDQLEGLRIVGTYK